ncbi:MAG: hypothetical protein VX951_00660 [Planctomycetota bacterium]|nr:hypothetical protein [Planctomycetota bacterium]
MAIPIHPSPVARVLPLALGLTASLFIPVALTGQKNCTRTSTGLVPLNDMGSAVYKTFAGGLYPGGNSPPPAHAVAGTIASQAIQPLDAQGQPSASGRIVLVSIGMSNTTREFSHFVRMSNADPKRKPAVRVVDLAQGGMDARKVAQANHQFWTVADQRLQSAGLTPAQVQVAWVKQAIARPTKAFPSSAEELRDLLGQIARNLKTKFPNIRIAYFSSRIYAGYAGTVLSPEPYAYEGGFAARWLIEQQIQGTGNLNHVAGNGAVVAPWLAWGPYLWADGTTPRSDGLTWVCADFENDGIHPAISACVKVANMLHRHFTTDVTSKPWYGDGSGGGNAASVTLYGKPCDGSVGTLKIRRNSNPTLGNQNFALGVAGAKAGTLALFYLSARSDKLPIQGCTILIDFSQTIATLGMVTGNNGSAILRMQIPNDQSLMGAIAYAQWFNQDSGSQNLQLIGGGAATAGARVVVGN